MAIIVSFGQGKDNVYAVRREAASLKSALTHHDPGEETWWSGHLWSPDQRAIAHWEATGVVVVDVDYYGDAPDKRRRHIAPPDERREQLRNAWRAACPASLWHLTPRGARAVFVLDRYVNDPALLEQVTRGAGVFVTTALRQAGVHAEHDRFRSPKNGYAVDTAASDRARFFYMPNAVVNRQARTDTVEGDELRFSVADLAELAPVAGAPVANLTGDERAAEEDDTLAATLAKADADGDNDGSLALMRVARQAISLGVTTPERFLQVVARWNAKRKQPWSEGDLVRRFEDANSRWQEEGRATVPLGKYLRTSIHRILHEDRTFSGRFGWDVIDQVVRVDGAILFDEVQLTDLEVQICARYGFKDIPRQKLDDSIVAIAHAKPINRVTDYLDRLTWDGTPRIYEVPVRFDTLPEHVPLAITYWRKLMISACARAYQPGCKADCMLVLVGDEGKHKSSALKALAGEDNFVDTRLDLESKDAYIQLDGSWIVEWAELESVTTRAHVGRIKNFLSSGWDKYRKPYGKVAMQHKRRNVFVGSSNSPDLILDRDSDRRFWIVEILGTLDLDWFADMRDHLWAEAVHAYKAGERWYLPKEAEAARKIQNEAYKPDEPLIDLVALKVADFQRADGYTGEIPVAMLYSRLSLDPIRTSGSVRALVSSTMRTLGFRRTRAREGGTTRARVYAER